MFRLGLLIDFKSVIHVFQYLTGDKIYPVELIVF